MKKLIYYCALYIAENVTLLFVWIAVLNDILYKTLPLSQVKEAFELFKTPGQVEGRIVLKTEE